MKMLARLGNVGALVVGSTSVTKQGCLSRGYKGAETTHPSQTPTALDSLQQKLPAASSLEPQLQMRADPSSLKSQRAGPVHWGHQWASPLSPTHSTLFSHSGPPCPHALKKKQFHGPRRVVSFYPTLIPTCPLDAQWSLWWP